MKSKIMMGVFILLTSISTAFATPEGDVNDRIISSFNKEFSGAQHVQWSSGSRKDYVKVTFTMNEQVVSAYYAQDGNLIGVTRNIVSGQLPINLLTSLKKDYSNFWISDLFEMGTHNDNAYYITLENSDHKLVLKSSGSNGWEVYQKERKE